MTDALELMQPDPYQLRPPGKGTGLGEILQRSLVGTQEPYETPDWAKRITVPRTTQPLSGARRGVSRSMDLPYRVQLPNIFGEGAPQPTAPGAFEQLMMSQAGQTAMIGLGAMPGERELFHDGIATMPITIANFPTYGREGFVSLLSHLFLEGGYQQQEAGVFGEDVEYTGPTDLNIGQQVLKGVIDGVKVTGDIVWGAFDGYLQWNRDETAIYKARAVQRLFSTGDTGRPYNPLEVGFVDNILSSVGIGPTSARYNLAELTALAQAKGGLDITHMAAELWDLPVEVVAEIQRDPMMSEERLREMLQGVPLSQDALTNLVGEGGLTIAMIVASLMTGTSALSAIGGASRTGSAVSALTTTLRGGKLVGDVSRAAQVAGRTGYLTRKALQLNAINTAAGWTTRGFEWGLKQYGGIVGDEGLVQLADTLLWEMPWSMNPGLNLIDGFTAHPLRHLKQLRGKGGGGRRIVIGDEGSFSEVGAINLSRQGELLGGWLDRPRSPYRTAEGMLDVAGMTTTRTAPDDIRVTVAGKEEVLPKGSPMAVLVDRIDALQSVDDVWPLLKGLGWQKRWLTEAFESGKYDLDMNDLRNFLIYGYAQVVRDRGFSPVTLPGATLREKSRAFFRIESPEIIDSFFSDLQGKTGHLAQSMKRQWWELDRLNDSNMAAMKAHLADTYDPFVSFESARHWIAASKRLHEAYKANAAYGDMVLTYARRLNQNYIRDMRDHTYLHYDKGQLISRTDINLLRRGAGPVEVIDESLKNAQKKWTREQFLQLLERLDEAAGRDKRPVRRLDPNLHEGWEPGIDFAAEARILGVTPEAVRAIEAAMRLDEVPASMPPVLLLQRVAKDIGASADSLAADPRRAWERIFDWYRERIGNMGENVRARDAVVNLRRRVEAEAAAGRVEPALATRVVEASDRISAELVNPPVKRPIGTQGPPPEGVVWASDDGMRRWTDATLRARQFPGKAEPFLDDPLGRLRVVGEETADERAVGQFVTTMDQQGFLRDLEALLEFYRGRPVDVLMDDAARSLVEDATAHPFRKVNALAGATWPPNMSPELRGFASTLARVDEDQLLRSIVGEVDDIAPEANVLEALDDLTGRALEHMGRRDELVEELLAIDRSYDAVEGVLTQETRILVDRRLAAEVAPGRKIISSETADATADEALARSRVTTAERQLADLQAQEAKLQQRAADAANLEEEGIRPEPRVVSDEVVEPAPAPVAAPEAAEQQFPDWVSENIAQLVDEADTLGLADEIEALSAQRMTAGQVANAIRERVTASGTESDPKMLVRGVRARRGIPSMDDATEFEAWLRRREGVPTAWDGTPRGQIGEVRKTPVGKGFSYVDEKGVSVGFRTRKDANAARAEAVARLEAAPEAKVIEEAVEPPPAAAPMTEAALTWQEAASYVEDVLDISIREKGSPAHRGSVLAWEKELWDRDVAQLKALEGRLVTKKGTARKRIPSDVQEQRDAIQAHQNVAHSLMMAAQEDDAALQLLGRLGKDDYGRLVDYLVEQGEGRGRAVGGWGAEDGLGIIERMQQAGREGEVAAPVVDTAELATRTMADEALAARARALAEQGMGDAEIARELGLTYTGGTDFPMVQVHRLLGRAEPRYGTQGEVAILGNVVRGDDPVRGTKLGTGTVESQLRLREADELIDSWDEGYPRERLQPRDTATQESEQLVREIAADPLPERLLRAESDMTEGAPVVSAEGWVEVGNHRARGLRLAYEEGNAEPYRQALIERAAEFGLDPDRVRTMKRPVLVREVADEYINAAYARAWNQGTGMAARSEAGSIGRNLDLATMADLTAKGTLDEVLAGAQGASIIKRIMGEGGEAFAKKYVENGVLNAEGQMLVKTAILSRIVGDERVAAAIAATVGTERGAAPRLARGILRRAGELMTLEQRLEAGDPLLLGDLIGRAHYLLREAEVVERGSRRVKTGVQTTFGAGEEAGVGAQARAYLEAAVQQGNATPEEAGFARVVLEMRNADEVAEFLGSYAEPITASADRAGTAQMFGEDVLGAGATRTQRLNLALGKVNEKRMSEAVKAAEQEGGTVGMFGSTAEQVEVREIPPIPGGDGVARSSFQSAEGTAATSAEVPAIDSVDDALRAATADAERIVVHTVEEVAGVPAGTPAVLRAVRYHEAKALRAGKDLAPGELRAAVERRIGQYQLDLEAAGTTRREALMANYYALQNASPEHADLANLIMLRAFSKAERWSADAPHGEWAGKVIAKKQDEAAAARALAMADEYEAALARAEAVAGPDDIVNISGDDLAIVGQAGRTVDPGHPTTTGLDVTEPSLVAEVKGLADTGAEVIVRGDDDAARGAAQTHGNLPRTPERDKLVTLNEKEFEQRRASLQNQLERVRAKRASVEEQLDGAKAVAREAGGPVREELDLPDEAFALWRRYVWDPLGEGIGVERPVTIGEVEDVLRSLDYGSRAVDNTMTVTQQDQLRVMLREFLESKYDEWELPTTPLEIPPKRLASRLEGGASGSTPTEHARQLDELALKLAAKVYKTDEPLEGYSGVGYEFIPPPTKGADGTPLSTRLFYETDLTDELRAYDAIVPGMGEELATGRMVLWDKRLDDVASHQAGLSLANKRWPRAAASLYDTAFGARRQQTIHEQSIGRFIDDVLELTPEERARIVVDPDLMKSLEQERRVILSLVRAWHERMSQETVPLVKMRQYRRVGLLGPERIERWTYEFLETAGEAGERILTRLRARQQAGAKTPVWDAWRKADNRIRAYFAQRNGGAASWVDNFYEDTGAPGLPGLVGKTIGRAVTRGSEYASGLTVTYHVFRFLMDARWLAMEFLEAPTLLLSREGPTALWDAIQLTRGKRQPQLYFASKDSFESAMSRWAWWASQTDQMGTSGRYMRFRENAVFSQVQRAQERGFIRELEQLARVDERLARVMRELGDTPADYLRRLDRDWRLLTSQQRRNIPEAEMRDILEPYLRDGTIMPSEVDDMVAAGTWTVHDGLQQAIAHADDPVTRLLLRRLEVMTAQAIDDASQLIFGQVDRSNVQRLMNHPLLYWPISYQIKATKWLGGLLLDRFMGVETGAGPAVTLGLVWEQHKEALQSDPDYHRFLRENQEALFFASMMLPVTPWDIGVSLSPWTRIALSIATGDGEPNYVRNVFSVGPFYSYINLFPQLIRERTMHDEGVGGGIAGGLQTGWPVSYNIPPYERREMVPAP